MRSDDFPPRKSSSNELRVMVIGDSIVYGGVWINQADIATELLKRNLEQQFHRPIVVANASAKGWGPPDELAYLKRFGTLDSDVVVLELSSHDYEDSPTFIPLVGVSGDFPDKKPWFALEDLFEAYILPRYLHYGVNHSDEFKAGRPFSETRVAECQAAENAIFQYARSHGAKVALVQHLSLPELTSPYLPGYAANQAAARTQNVPYVDDADGLRSALKSGRRPFLPGDYLHASRSGQRILSQALQRAVNLALQSN
jgi:hypothetical protein